jgi:hypothetical protein
MKWIDSKGFKNKESLNKIEDMWNVALPLSFKNLISKHNGGVPEEDFFDTLDSTGNHFLGFLNFDLADSKDKYGIINTYKVYKDRLPRNVYPISEDGGGNLICLDYRKYPENIFVVLWHHEMFYEDGKNYNKIEFIANSFDEFINKLYKIEKEPMKMDEEEEDFWNKLIAERRKEEGIE